MRFLNRLLVRRRRLPRFSALSDRVRERLVLACRELSDAEKEMAEELDLSHPPRLIMVDEEEAVIVSADDRENVS